MGRQNITSPTPSQSSSRSSKRKGITMAFSGFKKSLGKTSQYLSEKMGKAEGSRCDEEFVELEKRCDSTARCMESLNEKVMEYLQPNPVTRAKLATQATYAKARGTAAEMQYPQTERTVGEILTRSAVEIGTDSSYAKAVAELGEGFMKLANIKDSLDCDIKQNFIDPMDSTLRTDYKENIMNHRKKMESRRLDYDYKISQHEKGKVTDDDLYTAEDKFNESMQQADVGMKKFVVSEEEHIHQLMALVGFMKTHHENALRVLDETYSNLECAAFAAKSKPQPDFKPVSRISSVNKPPTSSFHVSGPTDARPMQQGSSPLSARPMAPPPSKPKPSAKALFDFDAEAETELDLREGDIVSLIKQIDSNWFEGEVNGRRGFFPTNYVEVINPL